MTHTHLYRIWLAEVQCSVPRNFGCEFHCWHVLCTLPQPCQWRCHRLLLPHGARFHQLNLIWSPHGSWSVYPIYPTLDGDMTTRLDGKMDGIATLLPKKSHHARITRSTKTWPLCHFLGNANSLLAIHGYSLCNQWIWQRETNSDSRNSELAHSFQGVHVENYLWGYVRVWTTSKPWPRIESDT